jgi:alginate O-acetyltransferase complex protein AlgI
VHSLPSAPQAFWDRLLVRRSHSIQNFASGVRRFVLGLSKKVLIANVVAQPADRAFGAASDIGWDLAWVGLVAYALQIYFDFSGYSDMAIGLGRMFGFEFPENFNAPYSAVSVTDFWRRWHLSLSMWFRDYLYIPLGGNRAGEARTYINLVIVFVLCGLWHGASWTFLYWGLYHGLFLIVERRFSSLLNPGRAFAGWIWTASIVLFGWMIFRCSSLADVYMYSTALFSTADNPAVHLDGASLGPIVAFLAGVVLCIPSVDRFLKTSDQPEAVGIPAWWPNVRLVMDFSAFGCCIQLLLAQLSNPFIYFRF